MATFAKEVMRAARQDKDLSTRQLAQLIGKSHAAVVRYENGENIPDLETMENIAQILGLSVHTLIIEERTMNEAYQFALNQEVLKEYAADIYGAVVRYMADNDDASNSFYLLRKNIARIQNRQILQAKDDSELDRLRGALGGYKTLFEDLMRVQTKVA